MKTGKTIILWVLFITLVILCINTLVISANIIFARNEVVETNMERESYYGGINHPGYRQANEKYEQAKEYGHSVEREFAFLLVHGVLHLHGYDHLNEDDEKVMFSLQDEMLNSLNYKR